MSTLLSLKKVELTWLIGLSIVLLSITMNGSVYASTAKSATSAQLKVTPKPCVALRKGQKCYLEVTFTWQHPKASNYCLVNSTSSKVMKCWDQQAKGEFSFDFQSTQSNEFALRKLDSAKDIVSASIPVAWVYKSSRRQKSTWRLF